MLIISTTARCEGLPPCSPVTPFEEVRTQGWEELANGELIDKNIRSQQNLTDCKIARLELEHSQWPMVKLVAKSIAAAVDASLPGTYA
jgi:hypothetical protein